MFQALTTIGLLAYLAASFLFLVALAARQNTAPWGLRVVTAAMPVHVVSLLWLGASFGLGAMLSMPNGLSLIALILVGGFLILNRVYQIRSLGSLVAPLSVILLSAVLLADSHEMDAPLGGALLSIHIVLAFLGTVSFALAFFASALYTLQSYQLKHKRFGRLFHNLPPLDRLDQVGFKCVTLGFPIYTAAILLGILWAGKLGGGFTGTSSILAYITWGLYGVVLFARAVVGWRGRKGALITMVGFLSAWGALLAYSV